MAILKKTLFPEDLNKYSVFLNDTDNRYFKVSEIPDVFTGGKNAFLIAGSEHLVHDTVIKIELKDSKGNVIYHEPGEGLVSATINNQAFVTQYYEGTSKVVAVYVYPDTAYGPCTLTILGELKSYIDATGNLTDVPVAWAGTYNVKFETQVNVNPNLANTTKIRFYRRPYPTITETLQPIYQIISGSKVNSGIYQSFANVKLSNLETFAGDVKRVKVFRTSNGDISDYDLIQDILVESKELLTTYNLSSSVVGTTGIFSQEVLNNFWNTGSLRGELTSSRVENGLKISGSGILRYLQPIDFKSGNTYELSLNAFYSGTIDNTLTAYIASGSTTSSVAVLEGIAPTKNLKDSIYQFKVDNDYISSSLFFSQSNAEWHLGNLSLKLTQETAFSPDEITFVTSMPTVVGNETYNFKFEFYDVNNNYVPVYVTQSAQFTGGTNFNNIILAISSSASGSLSGSINYINQVSSSISGTAALYLTSSVATASAYLTQSIATASYSSSIVSASVYSLSGSVSSSLTIVSGGITLLSGSFLQFTQSYYSASASFDTRFVSQSSYASSQSLYQVYSASAYLDTFIFTDNTGKVNQPPTASSPGLYLGSTYLGYYSGSGTAGWKTYMADNGNFYLTSSIANSGFLAWNAASATLQIQGAINIQGGNAATTSSLNNATSSLLNSINSATQSLSSSLYNSIFTNQNGQINKPPSVLVGSPSGLYLGSTYLGYYNGTDWKTYMSSTGNFYLSGTGTNGLTWNGSTLSIRGTIKVDDGTEVTTATVTGAAAGATALQSGQTGKSLGLTGGSVGGVTIASNKIYVGTGTFGNANTGFYVDSDGNMSLKDKLTWDGTTLTITGNLAVGSSVPNTAVTGLGTLATKNSVSATSDVTGLGSLATKSSVSATSDVTGLGSLATKDTVSATTDITGLGSLATKSSVTNAELADNAVSEGKIALGAVTSGKISAGAIVAEKIGAGEIIADKIASSAITAVKIAAGVVTADKITVGDLTGLNAKIGGWSINSSSIYNTNVQIDNANSRIDFLSGGTIKTRVRADAANIGATAVSAINIPAQGSSNYFYQGNGSTYGAQDKTFTLSQPITETSITTPSGTTGNKLSLKIPTYTIGTLGTVNFTNMGNALSYNYGYKAYVTYKVSSTSGASGDISSGTYYFYNGNYNDFT